MKKNLILIAAALLLAMPFSVLTVLAASESSGTITMEFDLSGHPSDQETKLWIPYPLSDRDQLVSNIAVSGNYAQSAVYSDQKYSTPMLYARWDKGTNTRKLVLKFSVTRQEVIRKDFPKQEAPWDPADYALYLAPTSLGPIDGVVKDLADKIVGHNTTVYSKAKAIYDWTCENMYRDPNTKGCGPGDVCSLLQTPGGKCTDIHSVFVSLCRAVGVPAREVFGIRQGKKEIEDITTWQHCWAEFFLPGYGWVPVDPADVRKMMLTQNLKLDDQKTKEYREYFWGAWDAYRVKLAIGRDLLLNPPQAGKPLNTFGYPYAEIGGKALDWLEPATFKYTITYHK
ncbi:transglutaminase domain-containing protein [Desulfopila sp. IMCC35006]|uniref:transglutaminase-like domain-containing protein n=1 Tax=Desulfopila sp. IMCC35006 TaxID=2569542 RepID=UPI0010AD00EA|nr:transglutaminase domain-containing protein [Desulfopila sp. IMCC35006]TKB27148.1 transglutaminase domain-containing protein [Desulfopila sp. IMCC35006]